MSLSNCIKSFDHYQHHNFMTFRGENSFSTITGGIIKLLLLVFIIAFFGYSLNQIIDKKKATMNQNSFKDKEGVIINSSNFMMGIVLFNDFTDPIEARFGGNPLEECTEEHWKLVDIRQYRNYVKQLELYRYTDKLMCLPLNYSIKTISIFEFDRLQDAVYFNIDLPTDRIGTNTTTFNFIYSSALISTDQNTVYQMRRYAIDYVPNYHTSLYVVQTPYEIDQASIYPFVEDKVIETGVMTRKFQVQRHVNNDKKFIYEISGQKYLAYSLALFIIPQGVKESYVRSYNSVISAFYVAGGLFAALIGLIGSICCLGAYSQTCYKLSAGLDLFSSRDGLEQQFKLFSIFTYFKMNLYKVASKLDCYKENFENEIYQSYRNIYEQINHQMCIKTLLMRLSYLQKCVYMRNENYQNVSLFLTDKLTAQEARGQRQYQLKLIEIAKQQKQRQKQKQRDKIQPQPLQPQLSKKPEQFLFKQLVGNNREIISQSVKQLHFNQQDLNFHKQKNKQISEKQDKRQIKQGKIKKNEIESEDKNSIKQERKKNKIVEKNNINKDGLYMREEIERIINKQNNQVLQQEEKDKSVYNFFQIGKQMRQSIQKRSRNSIDLNLGMSRRFSFLEEKKNIFQSEQQERKQKICDVVRVALDATQLNQGQEAEGKFNQKLIRGMKKGLRLKSTLSLNF